jgi:hypothetical protein
MTTQSNTNATKQPNPKKLELAKLSDQLIQATEKEEYFVNELLREHYKQQNPEIQLFEFLHSWNEKGFRIRKGEKAFLFWSSPVRVQKTDEQTGEESNYEFFNVCYLFANTQVEKAERLQNANKKIKSRQ